VHIRCNTACLLVTTLPLLDERPLTFYIKIFYTDLYIAFHLNRFISCGSIGSVLVIVCWDNSFWGALWVSHVLHNLQWGHKQDLYRTLWPPLFYRSCKCRIHIKEQFSWYSITRSNRKEENIGGGHENFYWLQMTTMPISKF